MSEPRRAREVRSETPPSSFRNGARATKDTVRSSQVIPKPTRAQQVSHPGPKRQLSRQKDSIDTDSLELTPPSESFASEKSSSSEKRSIRAPRIVRSASLNKPSHVKESSQELGDRTLVGRDADGKKAHVSAVLLNKGGDGDRRRPLNVKHRLLPSTPSSKIKYAHPGPFSEKGINADSVPRIGKDSRVDEIELVERTPFRGGVRVSKDQASPRSPRLVRGTSLTTDSKQIQLEHSNEERHKTLSPVETSGGKIDSSGQNNTLETYKSDELTNKGHEVTLSRNQRNKPYELVTKSNLKELSPGHADLASEGLKVKHTHFTLPSTQKHYLSPDTVPSSMIEKSKSTSRLQNQSSTETSGLGETITSGFSSQESIASYTSGRHAPEPDVIPRDHDQGIDLREDTTDIKRDDNYPFEGNTIDHNTRVLTETGDYGVDPRQPAKDGKTRSINDSFDRQTSRNNRSKTEAVAHKASNKPMKELSNHQGRFYGPTDPSSGYKDQNPHVLLPNDAKTAEADHEYSAEPDFDELFIQSETLPLPQQSMGLPLEQINTEWGKHQRSPSIKSRRSSVGSFRSRSGSTRRSKRYLTQRESKWMKWGRDRRASYRRRMENLEKPDPEVPARASTPVKKARQEGLMFVHPDLESKYISEEDINYIQRHRQQRLQTYKVIDKNKKINYQHEHFDLNRLTASELSVLSRFWEHRVFVRSRYISILLSMISTLLHIISICSGEWISYRYVSNTSTSAAQEGLWFRCQAVIKNGLIEESCDDPAYRNGDTLEVESSLWEHNCPLLGNNTTTSTTCLNSIPHWQNAVIGLMIFSAVFGFVAAVLAICGVVTSPLPRKIYYFHSSGEIFFVCALSSTVALVIYPIAIALDETVTSHLYGSGYGLGWGGTAFFFAASFCMSLDDLVRESAQNKCCRYLCWRSRSSEGDGTQNV